MQEAEAAFEVHPYDRRQPALTFRARGTINLNLAAYTLLGKPEAVLLMFDPTSRRVGVKSTDKDDLRAYPVNKHRKNNATIPANNFLKHYDIHSDKTIRYDAQVDGDMLVVQL